MEDNRDSPATKGDLADVKASVDNVMETLRDVETKLLTAFYSYAKTNDKRILEAEGNETLLRSCLATLETRVTDIEERLNRPSTKASPTRT